MVAGWFEVTYRLRGDGRAARRAAEAICVEQSIEFPPAALEPGAPSRGLIGRIAALEPCGEQSWRAAIRYPAAIVGGELPQLLNVIFGNSSLKPGILVEGLEPGPELLAAFPGPRFGAAGVRAALAVADRPLLATALKPLGRSAAELAAQARACALGGIDIVKDDHGLSDQAWAPFAERVARCAEAVALANRETGRRSIYMANVSGPLDRLPERARFAAEHGAGGLLVAPGLAGWDSLRWLADAPGVGLPLMAHPALLGGWLAAPDHGIAPGLLLGGLARLAGADISIGVHEGRRFPADRGAGAELAAAAGRPMGGLKPILPALGGGLTLDQIGGLRERYGREVVFLIGGGLHTWGPDLAANCRALLRMVEA